MPGNMYAGVKTWNPLAGRCKHECRYCSTHTLRNVYPNCRTKYEGEYRIDLKAFNKTQGRGNTIFLCAQNDLFEAGVPDEIIHRILQKTREPINSNNLYMVQTKNPARMLDFMGEMPYYAMYGTTIETNIQEYAGAWSDAPPVQERANAIRKISSGGERTFITIEPVMKFETLVFIHMLFGAHPNKVFIGADSKHNGMPEPAAAQLTDFIERVRLFAEVEVKTNLSRVTEQTNPPCKTEGAATGKQ